MKPANFLHLFAIILLACFTYTEHRNLNENYKQRIYELRVAKSHTARYAGKTEAGKSKLAGFKVEMEGVKAQYLHMSGYTGYKAMVVLGLFLAALWQFSRYFKLDFGDRDDHIPNTDYQRKTWLLNFVLFFVAAAWSLYFRQNNVFAAIFYLVAIGALIRSLMLATELRLEANRHGGRGFMVATVITSVILYANLLLLGGVYYVTVFTQQNLIEVIADIIG